MRFFDFRHGGKLIIALGVIATAVATYVAEEEEAYEERMMIQSSTAPIRNAVEREFAKYGTMQAVAALTSDPLAGGAGQGIRTYLMGETLERLYPAVKFVAFVRVVAKEDLADYLRNSGLTLGFDEGGLPAWTKTPKGSRDRYYFLENVTPQSPRGIPVGTELGDNPEFVRGFELAAQRGSIVVTPSDSEAVKSMPGTVVVASVDRPSSRLFGRDDSTRGPTSSPATAPADRSSARLPYGLLVSGVDFPRLMKDALRDMPANWHARLSAVPRSADDALKVGNRGVSVQAGFAGKPLFDSYAAAGGNAQSLDDPAVMEPYEFEAWGARLRLEIEGEMGHEFVLLELMPWATFLASVLLFTFLHVAYMRIRNARMRARSLAQEARTSTERFRDIVETSSDWIWELDEKLRFTYLSPTTETLLGYRPADLLYGPARRLLAAPDQTEPHQTSADPSHKDASSDAALSGLFPVGDKGVASYTGFERRLRHKDGHEVIVESAGTPIVDDEGSVTGYRGIDRDVTQQRQFRERLSQLHEDLARHMQTNLAGQLLSGLAHELNQPLSAILTYNQACLRLLKSGNADPADISAAMQSTADNVLHARDILQRLRRFTARREPHAVATPLAPLVQNCLGLIEIRLRSLDVEARIDIPAALPPVLADPILAAQVFLNVFNNAIDAMRDSTLRRISVHASLVTGRNVQVRIEDSGPGIAAENLPRLFEVYFTTKPEGTGIGLPLCRSIIEAMGGSIRVSSEPGHGAVVDLEFPVASRDEARDEAGDAADGDSSAGRLAA